MKAIIEKWRAENGKVRTITKTFIGCNDVIQYVFDDTKTYEQSDEMLWGIKSEHEIKRKTQDKTDYQLTIDFLTSMIDSGSKLINFTVEKITLDDIFKKMEDYDRV